MRFEPRRCEKTGKIFCLVSLEENETKENILKRENKIKTLCLDLCQSEDEVVKLVNSPIEVIGEACGYYIVLFLDL